MDIRRLIDQEDGAEGIYCTVFHKEFSGNEQAPGYAKFELLNGYEDYPVVVTNYQRTANACMTQLLFHPFFVATEPS